MTPIKLAIVAPCYNEAEMLPISLPRLLSLLDSMTREGKVSADSFLLLVNDGSRDSTWQIITEAHERDKRCHGLNLSCNVGHQNAIMAGMLTAVDGVGMADAVVTIDADLQDPLECIPEMVDNYYEGYDVVYGVRTSRQSDSFIKRFTAECFYKLQSQLGLKTIYNHADFRFMSRRVVIELEKYEERNLYLRGIVPMIGYPSTTVDETRMAREAGETKYTWRKMLRLAFDGITSFSVRPMYMILTLGMLFVLVGIGIGIYVVVSLLKGVAVPGWSSLMLSLWIVGGVMLMAIGLVGLYVGKVYIETKHRPRYHVEKYLH